MTERLVHCTYSLDGLHSQTQALARGCNAVSTRIITLEKSAEGLRLRGRLKTRGWLNPKHGAEPPSWRYTTVRGTNRLQ